MIVEIIDENKWSPVPINVVNRPGGSGAGGYTYLLGKKGDSHVGVGATRYVVSGKIEGRPTGNHRDAMKYQSIDEFVRAARDKPGLEVKYVPFNSGGEVTTALMAGHVDAAVAWSRS